MKSWTKFKDENKGRWEEWKKIKGSKFMKITVEKRIGCRSKVTSSIGRFEL